MAQDSLVSPRSQWERDRVPQTQNSGRSINGFFSCRESECYCNMLHTLLSSVLCLLFRASLLRTYIHTQSC